MIILKDFFTHVYGFYITLSTFTELYWDSESDLEHLIVFLIWNDEKISFQLFIPTDIFFSGFSDE